MDTQPITVTEFRGTETSELKDSQQHQETLTQENRNTTGPNNLPVPASPVTNSNNSGHDSSYDSGNGSTESERPKFHLGGDDHDDHHELRIEVPQFNNHAHINGGYMNGPHMHHSMSSHLFDDPALATIAYSNHSFDVNYDESDPHERAVVSFVIEEESQTQKNKRRHQKGTM